MSWKVKIYSLLNEIAAPFELYFLAMPLKTENGTLNDLILSYCRIHRTPSRFLYATGLGVLFFVELALIRAYALE